MKKLFATILLAFAINIGYAAVYIKYYNKDSKKHKMTVKMDGSTKTVKFSGSTTGAVTIQGSGKKCIIETACGKVEVNDGDKIEIKDGCIKIIKNSSYLYD